MSRALALAVGRRLVFGRVALDEGVERHLRGGLGFGHPDLLQRAFGLRLLAFRQLGDHVHGLVPQQRCSRVFGQTSPAAFQNPSAPSAMAICGGTLRTVAERNTISRRSGIRWQQIRGHVATLTVSNSLNALALAMLSDQVIEDQAAINAGCDFRR
jgi:hypothetical protein